MAQGNFVSHHHGGFQARATCLLQVKRRGLWRQGGGEHTLAHQIEVTGVLHDRTGNDITHTLAMQVKAVYQSLQGGSQHLLVGGLRIDRVGAGKRDTVAAQNGDAANGGHGGLPCRGLGGIKKKGMLCN